MQPLVDLRELQAKWVVFVYLSIERVRPFHVSLKFCYIFFTQFLGKDVCGLSKHYATQHLQRGRDVLLS